MRALAWESSFDPNRSLAGLKFRSAALSCHVVMCYSFHGNAGGPGSTDAICGLPTRSNEANGFTMLRFLARGYWMAHGGRAVQRIGVVKRAANQSISLL
jgi:hypothetical protein